MSGVVAAIAGGVAIAGGATAMNEGNRQAASAAQGAAAEREAQMQRAVEISGLGYNYAGQLANQQLGQTQGIVNLANSPQELMALEQSLNAQGRGLQNQERLFNSIDPAIMEASKQALQLLRGEEAKSLAPIKRQRQEQRDKLVSRLREQMGPGAETSTAGIQALNQFDLQTDSLLAGEQQSALGNLFGMAQSGAVNRGALNQSTGMMANIGTAFGNRGQRLAQTGFAGMAAQLNAETLRQNALGNLVNTRQGLASASGSQFVGDQLRGQGNAALGGGFMQIGGQLLGMGLGGMAGAPAPTANAGMGVGTAGQTPSTQRFNQGR